MLRSIYASNEWHEGGINQPTARDAALELNVVSDNPFGVPSRRIAAKDREGEGAGNRI